MKTPSYVPSNTILTKYANLIVEFGLQNSDGSRPKSGSVVHFVVPEAARPLYFYLQRAILAHGYQPLGQYVPSSDNTLNFEADFFATASVEQRTYELLKVNKAYVDQADCVIKIFADTNPHGQKHIPSEHLLEHRKAQKNSIDYKWKKINDGKLNWTLALYGTEEMAAEAGMTLKAYWQQIIKACYLDAPDPTAEWYRINDTVQNTATTLTNLAIDSLHIFGKDIDITIGLGGNRKWLAGGGANIPSFEVFTSPDWRRVDGHVQFNQPLYIFGKKIEGIELWFEKGVVVKSHATKNHDLLQQVLGTLGGDKLGEISLTDRRLSRITKFMAETLYDENVGGKFGNTHMAIGESFHDCYNGDASKLKKSDWSKLGFNESVVHHDIVSTTDRTVTATLMDGTKKIIYQKGEFTL